MNRAIPLMFVSILACGSALAQTEADKKEILRTFDSWNQGWTQRDADLAVRDYADDTDWTNAFGDRFQGSRQPPDFGCTGQTVAAGEAIASSSVVEPPTLRRGPDVGVQPEQVARIEDLRVRDIQSNGVASNEAEAEARAVPEFSAAPG